ncbi:MAG: NYN domain-containing protein [Candidatus Eisenbacteria bacterium]|nr:NYN domain-containing protein [Candidatus Eisenbacteria bacterium]
MAESRAGQLWIVDGHNAIYALPPLRALHEAGDQAGARAGLEALLLPFAGRLIHPLHLVYDGDLDAPGASERGGSPIRIQFSRPADDRIVDLAQAAAKRGRGVSVVTNDARLAARLPRSAHVHEVADFLARRIDAPPSPPSSEEKARREKTLPPEDAEEIAAQLLAHHQEQLHRPKSGDRSREQRARRRWLARFAPGRGADERPSDTDDRWEPPARRGSSRARSRVPSGVAKPFTAPASKSGASRIARASEEKERGGGANAPSSLEEAREAKRRRGLRKQARRIEALRARSQKRRAGSPAKGGKRAGGRRK